LDLLLQLGHGLLALGPLGKPHPDRRDIGKFSGEAAECPRSKNLPVCRSAFPPDQRSSADSRRVKLSRIVIDNETRKRSQLVV